MAFPKLKDAHEIHVSHSKSGCSLNMLLHVLNSMDSHSDYACADTRRLASSDHRDINRAKAHISPKTNNAAQERVTQEHGGRIGGSG
jgi:hypothetical protein